MRYSVKVPPIQCHISAVHPWRYLNRVQYGRPVTGCISRKLLTGDMNGIVLKVFFYFYKTGKEAVFCTNIICTIFGKKLEFGNLFLEKSKKKGQELKNTCPFLKSNILLF